MGELSIVILVADLLFQSIWALITTDKYINVSYDIYLMIVGDYYTLLICALSAPCRTMHPKLRVPH